MCGYYGVILGWIDDHFILKIVSIPSMHFGSIGVVRSFILWEYSPWLIMAPSGLYLFFVNRFCSDCKLGQSSLSLLVHSKQSKCGIWSNSWFTYYKVKGYDLKLWSEVTAIHFGKVMAIRYYMVQPKKLYIKITKSLQNLHIKLDNIFNWYPSIEYSTHSPHPGHILDNHPPSSSNKNNMKHPSSTTHGHR